MHGGLGDHPRRGAPVRPGRGVHHERMAQEDIPGLAGRVRNRPAQNRRPPELRISAGARLTVRRQELRDMQMRTADQPGRRVIRADIGEQQQRQQPACLGPDVDPIPARPVIAALNVIAGIGPVPRREPDHDRAAGIDLRCPPARADQPVIRSGQGRGRGRRVEQPAAQAVDVHQRRPGHGVAFADAPLTQHRPDHLPAGRRQRVAVLPHACGAGLHLHYLALLSTGS
jgi:hypothetical protein